jgi:signal transduction histidine kinase
MIKNKNLFWLYFSPLMYVMCGIVVVGGSLNLYFNYKDNSDAISKIQLEKTKLASSQIEVFLNTIENSIIFASLTNNDYEDLEQKKTTLLKTLRITPAITDISFVDQYGIEQLSFSRTSLDNSNGHQDRSLEPFFKEAKLGQTWFSPLYFRKDTEPYLTICVRTPGLNNAYIVAQVNLMFIIKSITKMENESVGKPYIVDKNGVLVASPEISEVLMHKDLSHMRQVQAALNPDDENTFNILGKNEAGESIFTSFVKINPLGWTLLLDTPQKEVYASLYYSMIRGIIFILLSLIAAFLLAQYLSKKMSTPLRLVQKAAHNIAQNKYNEIYDFGSVKELKELSIDFDQMSQKINATQSQLETQVAVRTEELLKKTFELEVANKLKSNFLANMSHELRTPLNAIIGFSDLLLEKIFGELTNKQTEYLTDIRSSGKHLHSLINDLLDVSKIEAGQTSLDLRSFKLDTAINGCLTMIKDRAVLNQINIIFDPTDFPSVIFADEKRFKQIMLNLLSNAVKFTLPHGKIWIECNRDELGVNFSIKDTGIGIPDENLKRIFEEFIQGNDFYTNKNEGTGLGLAITKKLVELHGGVLSVISTVGFGSVFSFNLPQPPKI